tara:strand:- start:191 stop:607 length:417 start_codon:yes stop_codon:yes gene_type:complete
MAVFAYTDASVTINSVDLSDHVTEATIEYSADEVEVTAMGDTAHARIAGLTDSSISVTFNQDYAASEVDATLFSLIGAAAFNVVLKPTSGSVSATNPSFTQSSVLTSYNPQGGSIGDAGSTSASFSNAGGTGLARATS